MGIIAVCVFVAIRFNIIPLPAFSPTPPDLSIAVSLEEPSGNGFLDAGETGRLRIIIRNSGGTVRNVGVRIDPPFISGAPYNQPAQISKLGKNNPETIAVSISADKNVRERDQSLEIQLFGNDGKLLGSKKFTLKIKRMRKG